MSSIRASGRRFVIHGAAVIATRSRLGTFSGHRGSGYRSQLPVNRFEESRGVIKYI